MRTETCHKE
ncbi:hypothetical protein CFC21_080017, partial [Triticum aestivum]